LDAQLDAPVDFHCIGGFVVSQHYGLGRETADLDVLAVIPREVAEQVVQLAGKRAGLDLDRWPGRDRRRHCWRVPAFSSPSGARDECAVRGVRHPLRRLVPLAFRIDDPAERDAFLRGEVRGIEVPASGGRILYDPMRRTAVGISRPGTSEVVAVGAYAFALRQLDNR